jgi:hypothetical protein
MNLTNCVICNTEVSTQESICPNCDNPILANDFLQFPELPKDLSLGQNVTHSGERTSIEGKINREYSTIDEITDEKVILNLHVFGIRFSGGLFLNIHDSQINSIKLTTKSEIEANEVEYHLHSDDTINEINTTESKTNEVFYLVINYWDIQSKLLQTLVVDANKILIKWFLRQHADEANLHQIESRGAATVFKSGCTLLIIIIYCLIIAAYYFYIYFLDASPINN